MATTMFAIPAAAQQGEWAKLPRMQLERQFAGPLQDTVIQRWRDPVDGTICYIYLPITAQHTPPAASGYVQYGSNVIGTISCMASPAAVPAVQSPPARAERRGAPTAPTRPAPPTPPTTGPPIAQ